MSKLLNLKTKQRDRLIISMALDFVGFCLLLCHLTRFCEHQKLTGLQLKWLNFSV